MSTELIPGRRYSHYKGGMYTLIGVSHPTDNVKGRGIIHVAKHTEQEDNPTLNIMEGWVHDQSTDVGNLVVYKHNDGELWARPELIFVEDGRFDLMEEEAPKSPEQLRNERFGR